jgi:hypothetical protein
MREMVLGKMATEVREAGGVFAAALVRCRA